MEHRQDLPPKEGYQAVQYRRNLPSKGPRAGVWLVAMGVVCAFGLYKVGQGNREKRELQREKLWARIHLMPVLQAEIDRDNVRRFFATRARDEEAMKDVKGWQGNTDYHSDRFVKPTYAVVGGGAKKPPQSM